MAKKAPARPAPAPPLILALETSGTCGSVALVDGRGCRAEYSLQSSRTHSRRLLEAVERVMAESETDWPQLDALAAGLGPGSFTGLRIGLSSAKGLALATGKPLLGISSLDGLAVQAMQQPLPVCTLIDARKQEVFAAFYQPTTASGDTEANVGAGNYPDTALPDLQPGLQPAPQPPAPMKAATIGTLTRTSAYLALPPAALAGLIKRPTLLLGSGAELYRELLTERLGDLAVFAPPQLCFARAAAIGWLAMAPWRQGEFAEPGRLTPIYVRPSDAQLP